MPLTSPFFGPALAYFRTLPSIPQCIAVQYLRLTLEKTKLTSHTNFMRLCMSRHVLPKGFYLKFSPHSKLPALISKVQHLLLTTGFRLMSATIHSYSRRITHVTYSIQRIRSQLHSLVDSATAVSIIQTTQKANRDLYLTLKKAKAKKFDALLPARTLSPLSATTPDPDPRLVVTIPPDLELPDEQRRVLARGMKFIPLKPTTNKACTLFHCQRFFRRLRLAAHFGQASLSAPAPPDDGDIAALFHKPPSTWTPSPGAFPALDFYIDICTRQIDELKPKPIRHSNLSREEQTALRDLKNRRDIVVKPADKGGAVVVWRKDLYLQEAQSQLSNPTFYCPIPRRTTKQDNALIRRTIKDAIDCGHLPWQATYAVVKEPREPSLYLLPKIHKDNNPGRPIVSACSCPTALISDFLDEVFQPLVSQLPTYVKDTNHTLTLLNAFVFPKDSGERFVFTMDIVSLYTNIPHSDGLCAVQHFLRRSQFKLHIPTILRLTELVLSLNSFAFGDEHFQQRNGVAMGTKMGPSFACLFVGYVEEQALAQYPGEIPVLYKRFIDDCLGVSICKRQSLLDFISFMSTFHPALQYTYSISDSQVSFLDITISIQPQSNSLTTSVFYKPTDSHSYLLYTSSHPRPCRDSIPYSQFLRIRRICSNEEDFDVQARKMVSFFLARQYPEDLVFNALKRVQATTRAQALTPRDSSDSDDRTLAVLTYHPHNLPVRNILLQNFHLIQQDPHLKKIFPKPPLIAFRRDTNLRDNLVRASLHPAGTPLSLGTRPCDRKGCKTCPFIDSSTTIIGPSGQFTVRNSFNCQTEDLVYVISCSLCNKMYTGETYRSLGDRFSEHLRSMRLNYDNPVGTHFNQGYHSFTHARVAGVWKNHANEHYRLFMESRVITKLGTRSPSGINKKD